MAKDGEERRGRQEVDGDHQRDATDRSIQGRNGAHCGHHYHGKGENHCVRQNNVSIVDFWQNRIRTKKFFSAFFLCRVKRVRQVRRRRGQSCIVGGRDVFYAFLPASPSLPFSPFFSPSFWAVSLRNSGDAGDGDAKCCCKRIFDFRMILDSEGGTQTRVAKCECWYI